MAGVLRPSVRAQRTAEIRRAAEAAPTLSVEQERAVNRAYHPRHTVYGDTPTTQLENLTALALASRNSQKGHRP